MVMTIGTHEDVSRLNGESASNFPATKKLRSRPASQTTPIRCASSSSRPSCLTGLRRSDRRRDVPGQAAALSHSVPGHHQNQPALDQPGNSAREAPRPHRRLRRDLGERSLGHYVRPIPERGGRRPVDVDGLLEELVAALETVLLHFTGIDRTDFSFAAPRRGAAAHPGRGEARGVRPRVHGLSRGSGSSSGRTAVLDPHRADYRWLAHVYESVKPTGVSNALLWQRLGSQDAGAGPRSHHRCPGYREPACKRSSWTRRRSKRSGSSP